MHRSQLPRSDGCCAGYRMAADKFGNVPSSVGVSSQINRCRSALLGLYRSEPQACPVVRSRRRLLEWSQRLARARSLDDAKCSQVDLEITMFGALAAAIAPLILSGSAVASYDDLAGVHQDRAAVLLQDSTRFDIGHAGDLVCCESGRTPPQVQCDEVGVARNPFLDVARLSLGKSLR